MNRSRRKAWPLNAGLITLLWAICLGAGCVSVKPIYNDREQAKAERAVAAFHKLHNEGNYEGLYNLLDA